MNLDELFDYLLNKKLSLSNIRQNINYCRENYDNWREFPIKYEMQISKKRAMEYSCDKSSLLFDEDSNPTMLVLSGNTDSESESLTILQLEEIIDAIQAEFPTTWQDIAVVVSDVEMPNQIYSKALVSEMLDEDEETFFEFPFTSLIDEKDCTYILN